ncbi:MAG: hypothetical protein Kow0077_25950 [Anaerolineae bacterium]
MKTRWLLGLLLVLVLTGTACAPRSQPVIPTLMVLPTLTFSPVPTVTQAPPTPLPTTPPVLLPTATRPSPTPTPGIQPTPTLAAISSVLVTPEQLVAGLHANCIPQMAEVRVVLNGPVGNDVQVLLKWDYVGRPTSRPGVPMTQASPNEFTATLGPFERDLNVTYRFVLLRGSQQAISEDYVLPVNECTAPTPAPTSPYSMVISPTPTPTYGAELSVKAISTTVQTDEETPVQIALGWTGGVPPYTIDRVMQPRYGALDGVGPVRVYIPNPGFKGIDSFTYAVTDGNGQASTGTITIYVGIAPPTPAP